MVRNVIIFYGEELLAPRPTLKLEDHPLSAVRDCLFNIFAATLHNWRSFLHPQPEDAPCRGDRDPLNTGGCHNEGNDSSLLVHDAVKLDKLLSILQRIFLALSSGYISSRLVQTDYTFQTEGSISS
jgi:hypothetical protein